MLKNLNRQLFSDVIKTKMNSANFKTCWQVRGIYMQAWDFWVSTYFEKNVFWLLGSVRIGLKMT